MNCHETRRLWNLYVDSEGDPEMHFRINEHLTGCESCRRWMAAQTQLEKRIREALVEDTAVHERVDWGSILAKGTQGSSFVQSPRFNSHRLIASVLACSILFLVAGWFVYNTRVRVNDSAPLLRQSLALHQHIASGGLRPDFESESDLEVDQYLVQRVSFPVRCPPRKDSGFLVNGAGLCNIDGDSVAYVYGMVEGQPVSIFVLPKDAGHGIANQNTRPKLSKTQRQLPMTTQLEDYQIAYSVVDQNLVIVTGLCGTRSLIRVLQSYGTYPHG